MQRQADVVLAGEETRRARPVAAEVRVLIRIVGAMLDAIAGEVERHTV